MKYNIDSTGTTVDLSQLAKSGTLEYYNSGDNTIYATLTASGNSFTTPFIPGATYRLNPSETSSGSLRLYSQAGKTSQVTTSIVYADKTKDASDIYGNPESGGGSEDFLKVDGSNFDSSKRVDYQKGVNVRDSETTAYLMTAADKQSAAFSENVGLLMFRDNMTNPLSQSNREIILGTILNQPTVSSAPNSYPWQTNIIRIADNNSRSIPNPQGGTISQDNYRPLSGSNTHAIELLNMALSSYSSYLAGIRLISGNVAINTLSEQMPYPGNNTIFAGLSYPQCATIIGGNTISVAGPTWFGFSNTLNTAMIRTYWPISFSTRASGTDAATGTRTSLQVYSKTETTNAIGTALTTTTYDSLTTTAKTIIGAINELKAAQTA